MLSHQVYIGMGSNLSDPASQLQSAIHAMQQVDQTEVVKVSSLYQSPPMGPQDQPDYTNAVAELKTQLSPLALLSELQLIEAAQGRERTVRWGARTLDLDILLYDDLQLSSERLTIPHYGMRERAFVLYPLAEIAPDLRLPGGDYLESILINCSGSDLFKMDDQLTC